MAKIIALYLPQYYPTKENDEWWGAGFTDWRTVNTAKPLFKGHVQPKVPGELGYYDLRLEETRVKQAELAKSYGVDAFCYWDYWFGKGKRLLTIPFDEVVKSGKPDFPFCLGWANHTWFKKAWGGKGEDKLLIKQLYPGIDDFVLHFNTMLPAFRDKRYLKHDGKLVYLVYEPLADDSIKLFISTWRKLAKENGLNDFFFIGKDYYYDNKDRIVDLGFDAVYNDNTTAVLHRESKLKKGFRWFGRKFFNHPFIFKYKDAIKYMITEHEKMEDACPLIAPNWDHSPRSGMGSAILIDSKPQYFELLVNRACDIVANKKNDIIILKSWNEWGEGNYMEPDLQYGRGMLEALKRGKH